MADRTEISIEILRMELRNILKQNAQHFNCIFGESIYFTNRYFICKPNELSKGIRDEIPQWFNDFGLEDGGLTEDQVVIKLHEDDLDLSINERTDFVVRLIDTHRCIRNLITVDDFISEIEFQQNIYNIISNGTDICLQNDGDKAIKNIFDNLKVENCIDRAVNEFKTEMGGLEFRGITWNIEYSLLVWQKEWEDWDIYTGCKKKRDILPAIRKAMLNGYTEDRIAVSVSLLMNDRVESEKVFMLDGTKC
ncbi:MAG: hypothetical protein VB050_04905 [Geobacteraceae bacterium]|nr:hypothetical protein [Geobacteraceae bacterium]